MSSVQLLDLKVSIESSHPSTIGNVLFVCMRILFFPGVSKIVDRMKDWLGTCNIPTENAGGVLKVVNKEEKVVEAKLWVLLSWVIISAVLAPSQKSNSNIN